MNVQDNEVVSCTILIGDIPGYPKLIWYDPKGITNILSMTRVEKNFPITYGRGKYFIVNKDGGNKCCFVRSERGIYYLDKSAPNPRK